MGADTIDETQPAGQRSATIVLGVLTAAFLALAAIGTAALAVQRHEYVTAIQLCQAPVYAVAAWFVLRHGRACSRRAPLVMIVGAALLVRAGILPLPPVSTDIYRYIWDGRMQSHGINPYRFVPADPQLEEYRDAGIFPSINRAESATTIYPPAAQILFLAITRLSESVTAMKAGILLFEGLTVWGLAGLMRRRGIPPARLLLYLWHPVPLWEIAGSGHVDAAAIGLMTVAILAADRRREGLAGALLALGAGIKYFPAFIAPALYRRWGWRMPAAFAAVLLLLYLPYLGAGLGVFGYLPGYAAEEGLAGGNGIFWLGLLARIAPGADALVAKPYLLAAGAVLLVFGVAVAFRSETDRIAIRSAQALLLAFIVVVSPHYPWYMMCLVPFLALVPSISVAYLTLSAPMLYGMLWPFGAWESAALVFGPFAVLFAVDTLRGGFLASRDMRAEEFT